MSKRFTDTNKYKKPFIRGLQGAYKLLWDYLCNDCDHAGVWIVDFEIAQIYIGMDMPVKKDEALKFFNDKEKRIIEFDEGKKWFIPSFIEFQYGVLNEENRAHNSVIKELKKYKLWNKGLISSLQGGKDKDKDKEYIFNRFYDLEILKAEKDNDKIYPLFVDFLFCKNPNEKPLTKVLSLTDQITYKSFQQLINSYDKETIKDTILSIENYTKKTVGSFNLTLRKWLSK